MSNLTKASKQMELITLVIKHLRSRFNRANTHLSHSLHHALMGYLMGYSPVNVFEIRPPLVGLTSLSIAQIFKKTSYYLFVKNQQEKIELHEIFSKTKLFHHIRTTRPAETILIIPDLIIVNWVDNKTIHDDIELLEKILERLKTGYKNVTVFMTLSPDLSAKNWYGISRFLETNTRPFIHISERVLVGKLHINTKK